MDDQNESPELKNKASDSRLNSFVAELIHIQDDRLVSRGDLEKLLEKYALSQDDMDKLQMLIDRHLTRAAEYSNRERWDNAIVETERALLFSPLDNNIRLDLAELFLKRSTKYGFLQKDLNRADHEIQDALTLEPENPGAKKFQKELRDLKKMLQGKQNNRKLIPLFLLMILILGIAIFPQLKKRFNFLSLTRTESQGSADITSPSWTTKRIDIVVSDSLTENFDFTLTDATLMRESLSGTPALKISGYLEPLLNEYSLLELELMPDSKSASGIPISLIHEGDAPLRMGETESFNEFIYLKNAVDEYESLYISIKSSQKYFEEGEIQWKELDLYNKTPLPQGVFLTLENRFCYQLEGYDRNYMFFDIRVSNRSMEKLSALDFLCSWLDEKGDHIISKALTLVESPSVPVKPQSVQSYRIMFDLPKKAGLDDGELNITLEKVEKE